MDKMEHMDNQTETKKINTGKIGFILSLLIIPTLCLSAIPSLILCIHGLIKSRGRKYSTIGLLMNFITPVLLIFIFITFTPPGSMPYPLNIYKFKRALECDFWLDYDKEHIIDVQSQNTVIISKQGAIHFQAAPNTYQHDSVIKYAEDNGWKYHLSVKLTKEDFEKYEKENWDWDVINVLRPSPILLKKDCAVLVFETGHIHGMASYIMISKDLSEMIVFFYNARLPDPAMKFWISEGYKELNKIQSEQEGK
jgi:hypothetical protein